MLLTMFLLGLLYVVFIGVLFAAGAGRVLIVGFAAVLLLVQFFASDKIALAAMGAKEVTPAGGPGAPRDDRPPLRPGRPAEAAGGDGAVADAERLRARALAEARHGLRDDGDRGPARPPPSSRASWPTSSRTSPTATCAIMTLASFFASLASMIVQFSFFFGGGTGGADDDDDAPASSP